MEKYSIDIVKKMLERAIEKVKQEKDSVIKDLQVELDTIKLEKELNKEFNSQSEKQDIDDKEIDRILGGLISE